MGYVSIFMSLWNWCIFSLGGGGGAYPLKSDDFFPYADIRNGYWTGNLNIQYTATHL